MQIETNAAVVFILVMALVGISIELWILLKRDNAKYGYLYWCNECDWEEHLDEHKHDLCPSCGHVNIHRKTNK